MADRLDYITRNQAIQELRQAQENMQEMVRMLQVLRPSFVALLRQGTGTVTITSAEAAAATHINLDHKMDFETGSVTFTVIEPQEPPVDEQQKLILS